MTTNEQNRITSVTRQTNHNHIIQLCQPLVKTISLYQEMYEILAISSSTDNVIWGM